MAPSRFRTGLGCPSIPGQAAVLHGSVRAELLQGAGEDLRDTDLQMSHLGHSYLEEG